MNTKGSWHNMESIIGKNKFNPVTVDEIHRMNYLIGPWVCFLHQSEEKELKSPKEVHECRQHEEWMKLGIDIIFKPNFDHYWYSVMSPSGWVLLNNG